MIAAAATTGDEVQHNTSGVIFLLHFSFKNAGFLRFLLF